MKLIPLSKGQFAQVDDEDYDYLMQWKWYATKGYSGYYAFRPQLIEGHNKCISMHRFIMNPIEKQQTDHKNRNTLNNQRSNLRNCSHSQNQQNKKAKGVSKYLGVAWHVSKNKRFRKKTKDFVIYKSSRWIAHITTNGKQIHLGRFQNEIDAARAYDEVAKQYHGEFANLNFK
jgi:hypothetical protein